MRGHEKAGEGGERGVRTRLLGTVDIGLVDVRK
jgi:hypothetical protein